MATDVGIRVGVEGEKEFRKAISGINSQMQNLDSEMRNLVSGFDSLEDAEAATAQRMDILNRKAAVTEQKISTLSAQYDRAASRLEELGRAMDSAIESGDEAAITRTTNAYNAQASEVNRLSTRLNNARTDLNNLQREMRDVEDGTDRVTQSFRDAENEADSLGNSLRDAFAGGAISGAVQSLISGITGLIEETTEYRKIMASLEVSSEKAGYSAEQTAESYRQLYGVLGDDQTSATALSNLQALGLSQEQLTQITDAAIGAWATYGDSIPIDGLAEAINETVKVGTVTGTFADVLNWAGTSEDEFNEKLEDCKTQTERVNLVMKELTRQGLTDAAKAWRENNKDLVSMNEASADMTEVWADMSKKIAPTLAKIKKEIAASIIEMVDFVEEHKDAAKAIAATVLALSSFSVALKVTSAIKTFVSALRGTVTAMRTAQGAAAALNAVMAVNPWTLLAMAISGVVTALGIFAMDSLTASENADSLTKKIDEQAESWKELTEASKEQAEGSLAQIEQAEAYVKELQGMVDANGKVTEAEADRAAGLYDLVNHLLPGLVSKTGEGENATYRFADSIDTLIEKQKALALQEAYQDDYTEAIKKKSEATSDLVELYGNLAQKQREYNDAVKADDWDKAGDLQKEVAETKRAIEERIKLNGQYQETINKYEALETAIASGNWEEAEKAVESFGLSVQNLGNMGVEEIRKEYESIQTTISGLKQQLSSGDLSESQRQALQGVLESLNEYLPQYEARMSALGADGTAAFSAGTTAGIPGVVNSVDALRVSAINAMEAKEESRTKGSEASSSYASGISGEKPKTDAAAKNIKDSAVQGLESAADASRKGASAGEAYASGVGSKKEAAGEKAKAVAAETEKKMDNSAAMEETAGNVIAGFLKGFVGTSLFERAESIVSRIKSIFTGVKGFFTGSPSRWAKQVGKWVMQGLGNGLEEEDSAELSAAKKVRTIQSVMVGTTEKMNRALLAKEEELNRAIAEMDEKAAEKQAAEELAAYKKNLKEKYEELGRAEAKEKQKIQDEIAKLQEDWNKKQLDAQEKAAKEQLQAQLSALQEFQREYESALSAIEQSQESMSKKLKSYTELIEKTGDEVHFASAFDLEADIEMIHRYGEALEGLQNLGVPDDFLSEITNMDIEDAIDFSNKLIHMSAEKYEEYISLWEQKQEAAEKVARQFYQDEMDALTEEFVDKIPEELSGVKDEMRDIGVQGVQGMIDGLYSQTGALSAAARQVVSQAIAAMRMEADIHSPSKKTKNLIGKPMGKGVEVGFLESLKKSRVVMSQAIMAPIESISQKDLYNAASGLVNGMAAATPASSAVPEIKVPVYLNGRQIAEAVYDPLKQVQKQRGY